VPCQECLYCRKDLRWLCNPHDIFGFHRNVNGAFAQYMIFPAKSIVYKLPESMSPQAAVYIEPLSCGVHAASRAKITEEDVVVVSGCGAIGLGIVIAAAKRRPKKLIALDCLDSRLELAKLCGADLVLNPLHHKVVDHIKGLTDNYGCDVYIEVSGNPESVIQGIHMIRKCVGRRFTNITWCSISFHRFSKPIRIVFPFLTTQTRSVC